MEEFCSYWHDNEKMSAAFSSFPSKSVNPITYDRRLEFWKNLIVSVARSKPSLLGCCNGTDGASIYRFVFSLINLPKAFQRNGILPLGMDIVIVIIWILYFEI